jgi:uncharacterized protein (DUF302 family)
MISLNRVLLALCASLALTSLTARADDGYAVYESESGFEDVMDALKLAIQEQGMYINNVMHMNEMLERTGKDLGMDEPIYGEAESIEFCSAVLSRRMTAEMPARIVNCPFIIAVYTLPDQTDTTYIVHRQIPASEVASSGVMRDVAKMLDTIASSAAEW